MHAHDIDSSAGSFVTLTSMWLAMMTGMMAPVAWPWVRAFQRFGTGAFESRARVIVSTLSFSTGYLSAWLLYSLVLALVQIVLVGTGVLDARHRWSAAVNAAVLVAAGAFQFATLKRACVTHCRSPFTYFLARWRNGPVAGFRLGFTHGLFCVGCCWALMATALVVGMTNIVWMLVLTGVVFIEQVTRHGARIRVPLGVALIGAGLMRL